MDDLEALIASPCETLEIELKAWLDLTSKGPRATLAKELIALANHGGGHVILGFDDAGPAPISRPTGYTVTTDDVNGIVSRYADPAFHCEVRDVAGHVVIAVPGGHKVPIRSKRGGPNGEVIENRYYIRRPGPNSETPLTGLEWDTLLRRCIDNREAELEAIVTRVTRAMGSSTVTPRADPVDKIRALL
jgi:predicted HTH transcriptional regulator